MSQPIVGVIMGSKSDLETMQPAADILAEFGVPCEVKVVSAHRTPEAMVEYAKTARSRGLKVVIAGAGGAAHLPGMVASLTTLPVIGVPVQTQALGGVDSLYSIAQMPAGVPVATVSIGNGKNAGLLALRILAVSNHELADKLEQFRQNQIDAVAEMNRDIGSR
jgi:5-(carboxyamino)imidazole ribonucleotide mutase